MDYKRDVKKVRPFFIESKDGGLICKADCSIQIPARWLDVGLGSVGMTTFVYGFFPLIVPSINAYMVSNVPTKLELNPFQTKPIKIDDEDYIEFSFEAGQQVIKTLNVIKKDIFIYNILDELILKGKVPWYASYTDMCTLFRYAKKYANSSAADVDAIVELIASIIARDPSDFKTYLRNSLENKEGADSLNIKFVPLASVVHSVNNAVNKLTGSYFADGINSELVHPSKKVGRTERILRA